MYLVACVVLVMACAGQPYLAHQPPYLPRRTFRGLANPDPVGLEAIRAHWGKKINTMKPYIQNIDMKTQKEYKNLNETDDRRGVSTPSVPLNHTSTSTSPALRTSEKNYEQPENLTRLTHTSLAARKPTLPPDPRSSLQASVVREARNRAEGEGRVLWPSNPWPPRLIPIDLPEMQPKVTAPPNVCDLCPSEGGKNPLDPCTCVGNGGANTGKITITCPSSIVSLDQLRDIFNHTSFLTTHVYQFTLNGSNVSDVLTRETWGDLDFTHVFITNNKITDVDNGAFISSADTLTILSLENNEIRNYVTKGNDLPNLFTLNLRRNNIPIIYSEYFNYSSLTNLDLSYNQIVSTGRHSFAALSKLQHLDLSRNLITGIDDERFTFANRDNANLLQIDLSWNRISYISENAFLGLRNVMINFQNNQLHTIQESVFRPIIIDSHYFAYFSFSGNEMICDCSILWAVVDPRIISCFENFVCSNNGIPLYNLQTSDLGNCTRRASYADGVA